MTMFPGSPRLLRAAIVRADPFNPLASVIVFQYNSVSMTRRLEAYVVNVEVRTVGRDKRQVFT